jgi:hypothetical protein
MQISPVAPVPVAMPAKCVAQKSEFFSPHKDQPDLAWRTR